MLRTHRSRLLLPALVIGVACGDKVAKTASDEAAPASGVSFARLRMDARASEALVMAAPAPAAPMAQAAPTQRLIRSATLRIQVSSVGRAVQLAESTARTRSALVADTRVAQNADKRHDAMMTIRVPADQFDAMLASLRQLGEVAGENISSDDITKAYADLETRLAVKEETVARLRSLLGNRTAKLAEVLEVERELGRAVTELEQMKGERRYYDHQVAMSSISLALFEPAIVGRPQIAAPVRAALAKSLEVLGMSMATVIYFTTFLLPWIALAALVWWILTRLGVRWPIRNQRRILQS